MDYFFHRFSFACLFRKKLLKEILKISRNRAGARARQKFYKEKYSLEKERKETENILLQQNEKKEKKELK